MAKKVFEKLFERGVIFERLEIKWISPSTVLNRPDVHNGRPYTFSNGNECLLEVVGLGSLNGGGDRGKAPGHQHMRGKPKACCCQDGKDEERQAFHLLLPMLAASVVRLPGRLSRELYVRTFFFLDTPPRRGREFLVTLPNFCKPTGGRGN
ncbi:MAG TPA: hypothetical protein VJO34_08670 [Methylomirabilota bacterium]|nr:hypothetical protein [Methylomirabilota bacterium]